VNNIGQDAGGIYGKLDRLKSRQDALYRDLIGRPDRSERAKKKLRDELAAVETELREAREAERIHRRQRAEAKRLAKYKPL